MAKADFFFHLFFLKTVKNKSASDRTQEVLMLSWIYDLYMCVFALDFV